MSNPLVADRKDSTKAYSGVPILESAMETHNALSKGDWASGALSAVGTTLDALGIAMDPFGAFLAAGVGWLIEHVGPLSGALDELTGDPDQIKAHAETWNNVTKELQAIANDLVGYVGSDTLGWIGAAGDAYRGRVQDTVNLLTAAATAAADASGGIRMSGELVAAVRTLVRDIISDFVGHAISWALQVGFTLGIGATWVVPQVIAEVAKIATKIADVITRLVKALKALSPMLKKIGDIFGDAGKAFKNNKSDQSGSSSKPDAPPSTSRGVDNPKGDDGSTSTSSAKGDGGKGSDNTTTSGSSGPSSKSDGHDNSPNSSPKDNSKGDPGNGSAPPSGTKPPTGTKSGGDTKTSGTNKPGNPKDTSVPKDNRNTKSDPMDVATGEVVLWQTDLELPGPVKLVLERTHVSSYRAGQRFGRSWASTLDQRLEFDDENVCYFAPDGMILVYPLPAAGSPVLPVEGPRFPLTREPDGTCTITDLLSGHTLRFRGQRRVVPLVAIEDEDQRIEIEYDASGAPVVVRGPGGAEIGIRAEHGRVVEIRVLGDDSNADVVVTRFRYNDLGHLVEVVNSSGAPTHFNYDQVGRLTGWQDRNGIWYRYVYDQNGRCVRTVGMAGFLDGVFHYDRERLVTTHTDSLGHTTVFQLNQANQTVRETDQFGHTTTFEWDRYDRLLSRTDPLGRTTRYSYDDNGRPSRVTRPDGSVVVLEEADGVLTSITVHGDGRSWRRSYGSAGAEAAPDPLREPVGVATPLRVERDDESGVVPDGPERDQFGRPRWAAEAGGGRTQLHWTVEGRRASRIGPRGERVLWRYDGEGNEVERIDELGRVTRREYGPFDVLTATVDPTGARTAYTYDTELRLVSVTNPSGLIWTYTYDAAGRLVQQVDFDGRTHSYVYDAAGQLVRSTDPEGGVSEYRYDLLGNLVETRTPAGTTTYAYDPVGEVVRVASAESVVEFDRDEHGRVVREVVNGRAVTFAYDAENNTIRRRTPSGAESEWFFDSAERPIGLTTAGHSVLYFHDNAGKVANRWVDETSSLQQSFGPGGRLATQVLTAAGADLTSTVVVRQRVFDYLPDGRIAGIRDTTGGPTVFERSAAGRVTTAHGPGVRENFGYDAAGNLAAWSLSGVQQGEPAAGQRRFDRNTVVAAGAVSYEHDRRGRRVSRRERHPAGERAWRYLWDAADQLVGVITPDGVRWQYRYDPLGRRIAKQRLAPDGAVAESVEFTWDGSVLIEQVHTNAFGVRRVVTWERHPVDDAPVTQLERGPDGEHFYSIVTDAMGTPTELVDTNGTVAWHGNRTLWGRHLASAAARAGTPLRFPGQYADEESGLHYNVYRYYDPQTARYLSQDPLGLEAGPNPVAYTDDPTAEFDPLGLMNCGGTTNTSNAPSTPGAGHKPGNTGGSDNKPKPPPPPKPPHLSAPPVKPKPPHLAAPPKPQPGPKPNPPAKPDNAGGSPNPPGKQDFKPPSQPEKFGVYKVEGKYTYNPAVDKIPGKNYNGVAPMQQHVSTKIVDDKIADWKKAGVMNDPVKVPVYYPPNNSSQLTIAGDKHHTFVAALQSGRPVELNLVKMPGGGMPNKATDWTNTTWAGFQKNDAWVP